MKITDKIISIPPYISTTWDKVSSIHKDDSFLVITLKDETRVQIPDLSPDIIKEIFHAHAQSLEQQLPEKAQQTQSANPFRMLFSTLESLTQALQHNPAHSNIAPLPKEIVEKIQMLAKSLPPEEFASYLHPVDGCNCMYCQISRILNGTVDQPELIEDEVLEDELHFEAWIVESTGDKMYRVTNKLDPTEQYNVYLGDPIGCTCGQPNCEHIVAVLRH